MGKYIVNWMLITSFLILLARVVSLAGIQKSYYEMRSRDNKITESVIPAPRGNIVDRKGRILAESVFQYFKIDGEEKIIDFGGEDFQGYRFDGKEVLYKIKRKYPYGESTGLITGYVAAADEDDLKNNPCSEKMIIGDDLVGKMGVESLQECNLRGVAGRRLVEVDAKGNFVRELGRAMPETGQTLKLTIDAYWQDKIYKSLNGKKAAVVISQPKTGKILALVSSPTIDPNNFSYTADSQMIKSYLNDNKNLPLINRTIAGLYHPGSVFKPIVATAGLESGVIDKNSLIEDTGVIKVGEYSYNNWLWTKRGATDGMVNVVKGLQRSNDIFFYRLGEKLGLERIKLWSDNFGLGQKLGIELPGELSGLTPDDNWKRRVKGEGWYLGDTYHLAIGQGDLSTTPLQINNMTATVANRGIKCKPTIIDDKIPECQKMNVSGSTWETVIEGMREACKPGGTAWPLFNFKTQIACKTGTAEVGDGTADTHAWLTAFAPIDNPEIAITVMVERGGEGSDVAAPIVGDILKEWFDEPNTLVPRYTPTPTR